MGRVLSLTTRLLETLGEERALRKRSDAQAAENAGLLTELRERQALLERLASIQRSIVHRADLDELLQAVVQGARELIGDEVVSLRLIDPGDPTRAEMVAAGRASLRARGAAPPRAGERRRQRPGHPGGAARGDRGIPRTARRPSPRSRPTGLQAVMAAPVHQNGVVCGSLVVGTHAAGAPLQRAPSARCCMAFAEHASLALTDARNFGQAMHQAFHDSLTGLPNRELFATEARAALMLARARGHAGRRAVPRPRRLQDRQRQPRPRRGRRAAVRGGRPLQASRQGGRHRGPLRRRRVRHPARVPPLPRVDPDGGGGPDPRRR